MNFFHCGRADITTRNRQHSLGHDHVPYSPAFTGPSHSDRPRVFLRLSATGLAARGRGHGRNRDAVAALVVAFAIAGLLIAKGRATACSWVAGVGAVGAARRGQRDDAAAGHLRRLGRGALCATYLDGETRQSRFHRLAAGHAGRGHAAGAGGQSGPVRGRLDRDQPLPASAAAVLSRTGSPPSAPRARNPSPRGPATRP